MSRARSPGRRGVYSLPLRQRLPAIAIPLRPTDADVVLDLQQMIDQCYERGRYHRIDYRQPPEPPLPPEEAKWAKELLRKVRE